MYQSRENGSELHDGVIGNHIRVFGLGSSILSSNAAQQFHDTHGYVTGMFKAVQQDKSEGVSDDPFYRKRI